MTKGEVSMDELESYSPFYGEFFSWVRQQAQDVQAVTERDVQLLLQMFEMEPVSKEVFLVGCNAASRLEHVARGADALVSAAVFRDDYDYCCFLLRSYGRS
jgi:hypothetical protein